MKTGLHRKFALCFICVSHVLGSPVGGMQTHGSAYEGYKRNLKA